MPSRRPRSTALRSALDRVLIHEIKNMGFRLQLLLSNLDEHYGDPDFKRSVQELLASTVDRLEGIVGRWAAHQDAVLIKVALDLNGVIQEVASQTVRRGPRRGGSSRLPCLSLALGPLPQVWGDPYYLADALTSLLENALEAAAPSGKVVVRTFLAGTSKRPRAAVDIIDNGPGMSSDFVRDQLFHPFRTTKPAGVGLGLVTAQQIVRFHRGRIQVLSHPGGGTVVRLTFPGTAAETA
jgi:signal transduction histidine kinase